MGYFRAFDPVLHFDDINGRPLNGGKLFTYDAGTSTKATTYRSSDGAEANENPIPLNERGECVCFLDSSKSYKLVLKDSLDNVIWEADNVRTQANNSVFSDQVFPMRVYTEGSHDIEAEYDPLDENEQNLTQRVLTIKVNGVTKAQYTPFNTESKEVDIPSESVVWDVATHSLKKVAGTDESTIVEVNQIYQANSEIPISGNGVANGKFVSVKEQSWNYYEKAQARKNIDAIKGGDFLPLGDFRYTLIRQISLLNKVLIVSDEGRTESGCIAPVAQDADRGKVVFVKKHDDVDVNELVYRFILENCATNSDVLLALQRGQIPCFESLIGTYIPYFVDSNGVMYVYNVFGVSDKNPMTGDALGKSIRRTVNNGNVNAECLWGKPYGLNYIEVAECKCNNNYHLGLGNETIMAWRRIPMDRDMVITAFSLIGKTATVKKAMMVGIFEVDGDSVTNVSASSTWTEDSGYYYNDMENAVRLQDIITSGSGAYPFVTFSLSEPLTLHAGKNYLFPCRFNDDNTYNDPWVYAYKRAVPAMPWEELVRNDAENGAPVMSTALPCCKPSALMLTLSDGTEIWI